MKCPQLGLDHIDTYGEGHRAPGAASDLCVRSPSNLAAYVCVYSLLFQTSLLEGKSVGQSATR